MLATRAQHLADQIECLLPLFRVVGKHRWNRRERGFGVDQQHVELLAHGRLEGRQRDVGVVFADASHHFETALVDRGAVHAGEKQGANDRLAQAAGCDTRLEFGDALLHKFAMQQAFGAFRSGSVEADRCPSPPGAPSIHRPP